MNQLVSYHVPSGFIEWLSAIEGFKLRELSLSLGDLGGDGAEIAGAESAGSGSPVSALVTGQCCPGSGDGDANIFLCSSWDVP